MGAEVRVPADKIRIIYVSHHYDHPLSGVCKLNGSVWWFEREYRSRWARIRKMDRLETIQKWWSRTLFGICVGWHQHYGSDGRRARYYRSRRPRFFWGLLFNIYYGRPPFRFPTFMWKW